MRIYGQLYNLIFIKLGNIDKVIKYKLQVIPKVLFEMGDFRSIRDFGKTTELTEWF